MLMLIARCVGSACDIVTFICVSPLKFNGIFNIKNYTTVEVFLSPATMALQTVLSIVQQVSLRS
jgi:hypothetical protein